MRLSNSFQSGAARAEPAIAPERVEALGPQIVALLPTLRLHSVSIFNAKGDVQWLNQGALGPDEQGVVEEALAILAAAPTRAHHEASLADNRAALFLAVRAPRAQLVGLVMVLMDAKITSGNLAARVLTTNMRTLLQKIALLFAPPRSPAATGAVSGIQPVVPAAPGSDLLALEILEPVAVASVAMQAEITFEAETPSPRASASSAATDTLRIRDLIRLRPGGRTRYYQVVPIAEAQRGDALTTLNQLLVWLGSNPQVLAADPVNFTIGLTASALADPDLPAALIRALAASAVAPECIGFELREAACISHFPLAERFIAQCEQARCFVVIDDFTFNSAMLDLLRSSAVRLWKIEARLATMALRDKLSQARVVAIAQASKVLGTLCAAKYVDAQSGRRWLAAAGLDFVQSSVTEPMRRVTEAATN